MKGRHLILDVFNITDVEKIETVKQIEVLMIKIIKELDLTVVNECDKQFIPVGATLLYLLAESHLSVHTFPQNNKMCIDLYCCNDKYKLNDVMDIVYNFFNGDCVMYKKIIDR
jgi:S-adenosylmethionine decarboxylase proenzyme